MLRGDQYAAMLLPAALGPDRPGLYRSFRFWLGHAFDGSHSAESRRVARCTCTPPPSPPYAQRQRCLQYLMASWRVAGLGGMGCAAAQMRAAGSYRSDLLALYGSYTTVYSRSGA